MKHLGSIVHSLLGGMRQEQATTQRKQILGFLKMS